MKFRASVLISATLAVLALALYWSARPDPAGFATPADCLSALCDASMEGDAARYLSCLAEPLRSETQQRYADPSQLGEYLRLNMQGVKSWAQQPQPGGDDSVAVVELEEIRDGSHRFTQFRLERSGRGWLIAHIGRPEERAPTFRRDDPVDEERVGSPP